MTRSLSPWVGAALFGASAAAHVGVLFACLALAPPVAIGAAPPVTRIDVEIEATPAPPPAPIVPEPQNAPDPPAAAPVAQTHDPRPATATQPAAALAQEAAPAVTSESAMPSFTIVVGNGTGAHGLVSNQAAAAPPPPNARVAAVAVGDPDAPVPESLVSSPARLVHGGAPPYPSAARADGVEGALTLELIVSTTGAVESVRVTKPFGHGLDEAAVAAARTYHFAPAMKDGHPVRVRMHWTMQFHLE